MNSITSKLTSLGFDPARLTYAARTAVAACIAFALAWAVGLEHPQWSAMTVWATSQPMRGHLLEKSAFRLAGTLAGTIAGVLLVLLMTVHPVLLVIGLALWVGLCTYAGNLQKGFIAYGALLAGYTAAMVALLDTAHPDHVFLLGLDRLATIGLGVIVAAVIGYIFAKQSSTDILRARALSLYGDILRYIAAADDESHEGKELLEKLSGIDAELDQHAAGSPNRHRQVHALRGLLISGVSLILSAKNRADSGLNAFNAASLRDLAELVEQDNLAAASDFITQTLANTPDAIQKSSTFAHIRDNLQLLISVSQTERRSSLKRDHASHIVLHKDIRSARDAAFRVALCLFVFGLLWAATGLPVLGFMLLGIAVMLSIFSNFENPAVFMRHVVFGQIYGIIAALACRWLVWPLATQEWHLIVMVMPFVLFAPLLVGHRKTVFSSLDYSMVSLLLLSPHFPLTGTFALSVGQSLAILSGPIIAIVAYRYLFPATLSRKVEHLVHMMLADIERLASDDKALERRTTWRARLYHRALILLRQASFSARYRGKAHEINRAVLTIGQLVMRSHAISAESHSNNLHRDSAAKILATTRRLLAAPQELAALLPSIAAQFPQADQQLLHNAAASANCLAELKTA